MILDTNNTPFKLEFAELTVALKLPLKNLKTSASTNATDTINTGTKAKELNVTGVLVFSKGDHLSALIKLAEAEDLDGSRTVYAISDETAKVADIREVIFHESFNVRKMQQLNAWNISFTLLQKNSVAEAVEARKDIPATVSDGATGTVIESTGEITSETESIEHGTVYQILKNVDNMLAPDDEN